MNTDDTPSLNSAPTMAGGGFRRVPAPTPIDEPSLGSAPTIVGARAASPAEGAPPSLGRIDQYELIRELGGGGFGVVYLARDTISGIDVALKTLHPLLKSDAEEMERLREKFALVSRLSHPNIASALVLHPCRDIVITDDATRRELRLSPGDSVMVMRYAPGITLSKWRRQFKDGVVPLGAALEVGRQIAAALDYAHGERIVHRDIKPANVMVETLGEAPQPSRVESSELKVESSDGANAPSEPSLTTNHSQPSTFKIRVRILDFGLAAEIRSSMSRVSTETGDTSGTRPYMAPEQWLGKKQDGHADQYALACVLYELLSGEPPFAGVFETGDPAIMANAVQTQAPDEIDGVSPAVNAALLKALSKRSQDRFDSCGDFVAAMRNAGSKIPVCEASTPCEPQSRHPARPEDSPHYSDGCGCIAAALLAIAAAAGVWWWQSLGGSRLLGPHGGDEDAVSHGIANDHRVINHPQRQTQSPHQSAAEGVKPPTFAPPVYQVRPFPAEFPRRSSMPAMKESEVCGAISNSLFSPGRDLVYIDDPRVWWESDFDGETDDEDDHCMHRAIEPAFRRLVELVAMSNATLRVQEAYRPSSIHPTLSLHREGRALDLTCPDLDPAAPKTDPRDGKQILPSPLSLEILAKLCWAAGFDWVYYEVPNNGGAHIHVSVRRDQDFQTGIATSNAISGTQLSSPPKQTLSDKDIRKWLEKSVKKSEMTSVTQNDLSQNFSLIKNALYDAWHQPSRELAGTRPAEVTFSVGPGGRLRNPRIKISSGSAAFDQSVIEAVQRVGAIPALAAEFIEQFDERDLIIEFKLND